MTVSSGDLIHADRHGALVVPADVVPLLEAALGKMLANGKLVLAAARWAFEKAWAAFEAART